LLEDVLHRVSNEPSPERREWLKNILVRVLDEPRDHAENTLLLRIATELSTDAQKLIGSLRNPVRSPGDQIDGRDAFLSREAAVPRERIKEILTELIRTGLVDADQINVGSRGPSGYAHF